MIKVRRNTDDIYSLASFNSTGGEEVHRQILRVRTFCSSRQAASGIASLHESRFAFRAGSDFACDPLLFLNQNFPVCSGKFMLISGWSLARLAQW
jgi:hypothetical protein